MKKNLIAVLVFVVCMAFSLVLMSACSGDSSGTSDASPSSSYLFIKSVDSKVTTSTPAASTAPTSEDTSVAPGTSTETSTPATSTETSTPATSTETSTPPTSVITSEWIDVSIG